MLVSLYASARIASKSATIVLLVVGLCLVSCGRKRADKQSADLIPFDPPSLTNIRSDYFIEDQGCQNGVDELDLSTVQVREWREFSIVEQLTNIPWLKTASTIRSAEVSETYYGRDYRRECSNSYGFREGLCESGGDGTGGSFVIPKVEPKHRLRVCKSHYAYHPDSYESVALSTLAHVHAAYAMAPKQDEISGIGSVPALALELMPSFRSIWRKAIDQDGSERSFQAVASNNLAIINTPGDKRLLVVFPESKEAKGDQQRYWESRWAVAHEYGHHLHATADRARGWNHLNQNVWDPMTHAYVNSPQSADGDDHHSLQTGRMESSLLTAISEATADLFAFYSVHMRTDSFRGIKNLMYWRNVSSDSFGLSGLRKILDETAAELILNRVTGRACDHLVYCTMHHVGAVFAHTFHEMMEVIQATKDGSVGPSEIEAISKQRARLAFFWYRKASDAATDHQFKMAENRQGMEMFLGHILKNSFEQTLSVALNQVDSIESRENLKPLLCQKYQSFFPTYRPLIFSKASGKCD